MSKQSAEVQARKKNLKPVVDMVSNSPPRRAAALPSVSSEPNLHSKAKNLLSDEVSWFGNCNRKSPDDDGGIQGKLSDKGIPLCGCGENGNNLNYDNLAFDSVRLCIIRHVSSFNLRYLNHV